MRITAPRLLIAERPKHMCEKTEQICEGKGAAILRMTVFMANDGYDDAYDPPEAQDDSWDDRVVLVGGVAAFIACPDCLDTHQITDEELTSPHFDGDHTWAIENGRPANCILCKDTGKMWVSI